VQQCGKPGKFIVGRTFVEIHLLEPTLNQIPVLLVAEVVATNADDAPFFGQAAMAERLEQGGHQLAPGKVAGAAKQNEIEGHVQKLRKYMVVM
jgi:hypothetical protein